jgi:hypothetical protein
MAPDRFFWVEQLSHIHKKTGIFSSSRSEELKRLRAIQNYSEEVLSRGGIVIVRDLFHTAPSVMRKLPKGITWCPYFDDETSPAVPVGMIESLAAAERGALVEASGAHLFTYGNQEEIVSKFRAEAAGKYRAAVEEAAGRRSDVFLVDGCVPGVYVDIAQEYPGKNWNFRILPELCLTQGFGYENSTRGEKKNPAFPKGYLEPIGPKIVGEYLCCRAVPAEPR